MKKTMRSTLIQIPSLIVQQMLTVEHMNNVLMELAKSSTLVKMLNARSMRIVNMVSALINMTIIVAEYNPKFSVTIALLTSQHTINVRTYRLCHL